MRPELLYKLRFLSGLAEGPRGPLFLVTRIVEGDPPRYETRLAAYEGGRVRYLTRGEARNPVWKGNFIYFLRKEGEVSQVFRLPLSGGEPEPVTEAKNGVLGFAVDGRGRVLYWTPEKRPKPDLPRVYEAWPFKFDGRGLLDESPVGVYLGKKKLFSRLPPLEEAVFGEDGAIYFLAARDARARARWQGTLWKYEDGEPKEVYTPGGMLHGLAAGPEGLALIHFPVEEGGLFAELVYLPHGGAPRTLFRGHLGNSVNSDVRYGAYRQGPVFGGDGRVYFLVTEAGRGVLYRAEVGKEPERVATEKSVVAFAHGGEALLVEDFDHGPRLVWRGREVYDPNALLKLSARRPEPFSYRAPGGHEVPGWVLLPEGKGPHPVILYIHGGPHTAFGEALMFEFQLFAAAGYAVVFGNPRGSTGYGEDYARLRGRWGEIDEADLLGLLDEALDRFPLDPGRVGVAGGSYGGYMTNWLTGRHPERFRAAVTDRSISNWLSFFGASDIGPPFARMQLFADPWRDPERLWEKSPLKYAHRVKAPTLVVHAEEDHRCPIDQGETWYTALLDRGVKARFFRVPGEGHELSRSGRPDRRAARLRAYLDWWREHL